MKNEKIQTVSCNICGNQDIKHEEKTGRGLSPKSNLPELMPKARISWRGIWDIYKCDKCGETWKKLR